MVRVPHFGKYYLRSKLWFLSTQTQMVKMTCYRVCGWGEEKREKRKPFEQHKLKKKN